MPAHCQNDERYTREHADEFEQVVLLVIILLKMLHIKCEPFGAVYSPNLHIHVLNEIFIKKVRRRKCEPLGPVDRPNLHNYY